MNSNKECTLSVYLYEINSERLFLRQIHKIYKIHKISLLKIHKSWYIISHRESMLDLLWDIIYCKPSYILSITYQWYTDQPKIGKKKNYSPYRGTFLIFSMAFIICWKWFHIRPKLGFIWYFTSILIMFKKDAFRNRIRYFILLLANLQDPFRFNWKKLLQLEKANSFSCPI